MSGWVPFPASGWAETAELLAAVGQPWPEAAAVFDLRWHVDQGREIPGRPTLARRWSWSDWQVRVLLRDEDRWRDPLRRPTSAHQRTPAHTRRDEVEPVVSAAKRQRTPAHTRSPPSRGSSPTPTLHDPPQPPADAGGAVEVLLELIDESCPATLDHDDDDLVRIVSVRDPDRGASLRAELDAEQLERRRDLLERAAAGDELVARALFERGRGRLGRVGVTRWRGAVSPMATAAEHLLGRRGPVLVFNNQHSGGAG